MRIVLDTNVLVSAFAARGLCADLFRDILAHHTLLISDYILDELHEKLTAKLKVPESMAQSIKTLLVRHKIEVGHLPKIDVAIRDEDDIEIVAFAAAVGADLLITGDRDLLDVAEHLPIRVISPRQFYQK